MINRDEVLDALRGSKVRSTPQRLIILSIVAHRDAQLGVDEVCRRTNESYPFRDVATVYRNLYLVKGLGLAIVGRLHYGLTDSECRHHHLVCRECGGGFNLGPDHLKEFSFKPNLDHVTITGICAQCHPEVQK